MRWSAWAVALALCGCGSDSKREASDALGDGARLSRLQTASAPAPEQAVERRTVTPFATRTNGDFSSGIDDRDVYGGLMGTEVGEMQGGSGLATQSARAPSTAQFAMKPRGGYGAPLAASEQYALYDANPATRTAEDGQSTFSIDVDTASYSIVRRKIQGNQIVPATAVRVEELVNYFRYGYEGPTGDAPFAVHMDAAPSPYDEHKHLLRIGVQGKKLSKRERKPAHLVFLVDVSGSMASENKLDLVKRALRILVDNLNDGDTVALVTYAGNVAKLLDPVGLDHRDEILSAIFSLEPGGGTSMGSGIEIAYQLAATGLSDDSVSRVIVLSDGDANIGRTGHEEILATIEGHVKEGVTLSTVGFGMGNYKDAMMEQLADRGNGNYYYIDSIEQARRVFQEQLDSMLEVIAKDVKIQVEFHQDAVASYRLVGYENRAIADRDFRDDKVDAGEIGAGHAVTALYEVELTDARDVPLATVRLRAKQPRGEKAVESVFLFDRERLAPRFSAASKDFRFAVAVMGAAEILRRSPRAASWKMATVVRLAKEASDGSEEREEFVALMSAVGARS